MRVVELSGLTEASTAGVLTRMDDFALFSGGLSAAPTIGGFRIVRPLLTQQTRMRSRVLRRLVSARLHATGSLPVLFIGAVALAILAGPASCPCGPQAAEAASLAAGNDAKLLSRFAYARASAIGLPAAKRQEASLSKLAALVDPSDPVGASPISTSAITPARNARQSSTRPAHLGTPSHQDRDACRRRAQADPACRRRS